MIPEADSLTGEPIFSVSRGRPTWQSSGGLSHSQSGAAVNGTFSGKFTFCTNTEADPWWQVDLGAVIPIGRIVIWNRDDAGLIGAERARPLEVMISDDAETWRTIASSCLVFGGRSLGSPFLFESLLPLHGRFVRLQLRGQAKQLHLDQVDVQLCVPPLRWATLAAVRIENETLRGASKQVHNAGFYSNCSTTLETMVHLQSWGIIPDAPDCSGIYSGFRDREETLDVHTALFEHHPEIMLPERNTIPDPFALFYAGFHHQHYRERDFAGLRPFLDRFFQPSGSVRREQARLITSSGYDPSRTVALCWRGTDKHLEVTPTDIGEYIAFADRILTKGDADRVLIQTDQLQARDAVEAHFGERCVYFRELPVSTGDKVIHHTDVSATHGMGRSDFARRLSAAIDLVAQSKIVLTHTGNVGLWIALLRRSADRLWQFDRNCQLVEPS